MVDEDRGKAQVPRMKRCMFDTNVFNRILDDDFDVAMLAGEAKYYVTHVQLDEIKNTRNSTRREKLMAIFASIPQDHISTESAVWDISNWDEAKWSDGNGLYDKILEALNERNKGKANNRQDALIAETAVKNGLGLVTRDSDLEGVVRQFGGIVMQFDSFLETLRSTESHAPKKRCSRQSARRVGSNAPHLSRAACG